MSSHRRNRDVDYDEDELDDDYYEEEDDNETTAEDKEQLRQGAIEVREALGASFDVTQKEIEEALWYYYFDVGKSITYLKNKSQPKAAVPAKQKPVSKFDQAVNANASAAPSASAKPATKKMNESTFAYPLSCNIAFGEDHFSAKEFFRDTPWLKIPPERQGLITVEPRYPRGRLLGGSSKPSKLAALAAARKKKTEEEKNKSTQSGAAVGPDRAVALLDRLGKGQSTDATRAQLQPKVPAASEDLAEPARPTATRSFPLRRKKSLSPPPTTIEWPVDQVVADSTEESADPLPDLVAQPSAFARTVIGRLSPHSTARQARDDGAFSLFGDLAENVNNPFLGPSPDDVVVSAQSKGNLGKSSAPKTTNGDKATDAAKNGIDEVTVDRSPRVKSKNLDVAKEFEKSGRKKAASFVVIGHVDHGKSTLMGRLLYDLKVVDQRSIDRLKKEAKDIGKSSFAFAWVMDQTSDERSRGVTVDIATNYFETANTHFTILDAPGHQDFIPNMIAGTSQADFAILVIDASTNSFESGLRGQTKEHALLARSIGVQKLVVAVNKMDAANWSKERYDEISQQMLAFLTSAGFQSKNISFIPCAGLTGDNVTSKSETPESSWYKGHTLVEALESSEPATRAIAKPLRLTISDVFRGGINNPVSISGRIDAGSLQVGDAVLAMPSSEVAYIKAIEADNDVVDWAVAGQIVTLHLSEIDPIHLRLGDIICHQTAPVKNVKAVTCKILAFEHVIPGYFDVHRGRLNVAGQVSKLVATLDKTSGEALKKRPKVVQPGSVARVEVEMDAVLPLEVGIRIVLRSSGRTVAAGLVERTRTAEGPWES